MKFISFVLPLVRFEESDAAATRQALSVALSVTATQIDDMVRDAKVHDQFVVNFRVTPEQFSRFLILRNDFGGKNWFADMKPRVLDKDGPIQNKRIVDFTRPWGSDSIGFKIHDDMPQRWVDEQNERRAGRRSFIRTGGDSPTLRSGNVSLAAIKRVLSHAYYCERGTGPIEDVEIALVDKQAEGIALLFAGKDRTNLGSPAEVGTLVHSIVDDMNKKHAAEINRLDDVIDGLKKHLGRLIGLLSAVIRTEERMIRKIMPSHWTRNARQAIDAAKEKLS